MANWFFPKLGGGEEQGLNDAGVESFKRAASLGRETCQNIGDVCLDNGKPAIATFELIDLPATEFPGLQEFREKFIACRDYVLDGLPNGTGNEQKFFERGLKVLQRDTIPVLRIGDENTTGLIGSDDDRSESFFRLLKLQGASSQQGVGGGTYGIGQRAPFAHSALRTIFYSTRTEDGRAFIAKSILASFPDPESNVMTQSKGWWCNVDEGGGGWSTIRDECEISKRFCREQIGTDLWVTGFHSSDWEKSIRHSVLQHFFAAIENRKLVLQLMVDGEVQTRISHENLEQELLRAADEARADLRKQDYYKGLGSTIYFHKALKEPYNNAPFETKIKKIGTVKLYLYRDTDNKDMPNRWATMRKPRIIVEHFGSGLLSDFAAVLLCDNDEGNQYLAQLEDPTHETWSEEETRNWTDSEKNEAQEVINEIKRFVKDTLKAVRGDDMQEQEDIPFLGRYLPAEEDDLAERTTGAADELSGDSTDDETGEKRTKDNSEPITGVARHREQPPVPTTQHQKSSGSTENEGDGGTENSGTGSEQGSVGGSEKEGEGSKNSILNPSLVRFRSYRKDDSYRVILQSETDLIGDLKLHAVGEESDYSIDIASITDEVTGKELNTNQSTVTGLVLPANIKVNLKLNINSDMDLCLAMGS